MSIPWSNCVYEGIPYHAARWKNNRNGTVSSPPASEDNWPRLYLGGRTFGGAPTMFYLSAILHYTDVVHEANFNCTDYTLIAIATCQQNGTRTLIGKRGTADGATRDNYFFEIVNGKPKGGYHDGSGFQAYQCTTIGDTDYNVGRFNFFAQRFNNTSKSIKFWVNENTEESTLANSPVPSSDNLHIGHNNLDYYFTGSIARILIFNTALTDAQVEEVRKYTLRARYLPKIQDAFFWPGSKSVSQWTDLSGNGNHLVQATAGNQPTIVTDQVNGRSAYSFTTGQTQWLELLNKTLTKPCCIIIGKSLNAEESYVSSFSVRDAASPSEQLIGDLCYIYGGSRMLYRKSDLSGDWSFYTTNQGNQGYSIGRMFYVAFICDETNRYMVVTQSGDNGFSSSIITSPPKYSFDIPVNVYLAKFGDPGFTCGIQDFYIIEGYYGITECAHMISYLRRKTGD